MFRLLYDTHVLFQQNLEKKCTILLSQNHFIGLEVSPRQFQTFLWLNLEICVIIELSFCNVNAYLLALFHVVPGITFQKEINSKEKDIVGAAIMI